MIPPKRFDISPLTGGCSEGIDALRFFFKLLCHHNPGLAGHERDWPPFQVVLSGRSVGDAPLFHTLPSSGTTMRQLCASKDVVLCVA